MANGAHMVTTSYMNPSLEVYDERFKAAGLSAVMEVGLDPGIDHLLALEAIDHIKSQGHRVSSTLLFAFVFVFHFMKFFESSRIFC